MQIQWSQNQPYWYLPIMLLLFQMQWAVLNNTVSLFHPGGTWPSNSGLLCLLFRFLVEFNLCSWWHSDMTAKGKRQPVPSSQLRVIKPGFTGYFSSRMGSRTTTQDKVMIFRLYQRKASSALKMKGRHIASFRLSECITTLVFCLFVCLIVFYSYPHKI